MVFRGEYGWLSNFYKLDSPLIYPDGRGSTFSYDSIERFYVAMKSEEWDHRSKAQHTDKIKKFGQECLLREAWEGELQLSVMLFGVRFKFSKKNPRLRKKLLNTDSIIIREDNYHGDAFWGYDLNNWEGANNLGKIIMKVRDEINRGLL